MKSVSMLKFRREADRVLAKVRSGERLILTHRGKPVARLEPIRDQSIESNDPFYSLCDWAEPAGSLTNPQIDEILYGQ
jgi:prevent-host-death family protein